MPLGLDQNPVGRHGELYVDVIPVEHAPFPGEVRHFADEEPHLTLQQLAERRRAEIAVALSGKRAAESSDDESAA